MVGLNISASFSSAVTIYILIPLLIIPQLLLSGVVINFDKFNPRVTKPYGVPLIGEVMASRWAFEAFMVTQFKDNKFEKQFYEWDKTIANAEYKRIYYIPDPGIKTCLLPQQSITVENHTKSKNDCCTGVDQK